MKITKLVAVSLTSVVIGQSAIAHEVVAPQMNEQEIILSTQASIGGDLVVPLILFLLLAAAVASADTPASIPELILE